MKVIYRKRRYQESELDSINPMEIYVQVWKTEAAIALKMMNASGNGSILNVKTEDFTEGSMTHVFWSTADQGFILRDDAGRWRDLQSHLWFNDGAKYGMSMIITRFKDELYVDLNNLPVYFEEKTPGEFPIVLEADAKVKDGVEIAKPEVEVVHMISRLSSIRTVAALTEGFEDTPVVKSMRARAEMMRELNTIDILSDLEKQVDLLTELVLALADKSPEVKPSWFDKFKSAFIPNSSLKFKDVEKSVENVAETKSKLRELQTKYFEAIK